MILKTLKKLHTHFKSECFQTKEVMTKNPPFGSQVFYFITPNMISFTHLFTGFVSGKFIASENLQDRRIGVILFQFRTWLDAFDGVVFRSQSNTRLQFRSVRNTMGYYVDTWCDAIGGAFLSFGVMFYLFKRFDSFSSKDLPVWNKEKEASSAGAVRETHSVRYVFWKVCMLP